MAIEHRVRLGDVSRHHRDPPVTPPKKEADHVLPEGGDGHDDSTSYGVLLRVYLVALLPPPLAPTTSLIPLAAPLILLAAHLVPPAVSPVPAAAPPVPPATAPHHLQY
ncbi:hypothetical protein GH714_004731 [Hevea brasiliensis]|uniref:Uncharacterized protein n=1 Tax=Hevea brasiliensis TaxID=3981 RepID=A0A6A6N163_HEVBR|nr:hypothetical protein GH714_004731 [Hevea brasiliensis]